MSKAPDNGQKATLLVLEDEDPARKSLVNILTRRNYRVVDANSGSDVINLMSKHNVDLLLLDIRMERPDGIDVATRVNQSTPNTPIVFFTAHTENDNYRKRVEGAGLNIAEWIQKPLDSDYLISVVERELDKQSRVKDLLQIASESGIRDAILISLLEKIRHATQSLSFDELIRLISQLNVPVSRLRPLIDDINYRAFIEQKDMLLEKYKDGYVAFLDGNFVGHNQIWDKLIEDVYKQYNRIDLFTAELLKEDEIIEILSPHITRNH